MIDFIVIERMQVKVMPENDLQENEFIWFWVKHWEHDFGFQILFNFMEKEASRNDSEKLWINYEIWVF